MYVCIYVCIYAFQNDFCATWSCPPLQKFLRAPMFHPETKYCCGVELRMLDRAQVLDPFAVCCMRTEATSLDDLSLG